MVATLPLNRIGHAAHAPSKPELPKTERERGKLWGDVVLEAVLALRNQLGSRNEDTVAAAANSILELERTRMRHDNMISGTRTGAYGIDEIDPHAEQPTVAVIEDDPPPAELSEVDAAIVADHAREIVEKWKLTEPEAKAYVAEKLARWKVRPGKIHRGEFVAMLGLMDELPGAQAGADEPDASATDRSHASASPKPTVRHAVRR